MNDQHRADDHEPTEPIRPVRDEPLAIPDEARGRGGDAEAGVGPARATPPASVSYPPPGQQWPPPTPTQTLPPVAPPRPRRRRRPVGRILLVCLLATVLGISGGLLGAGAYDAWFDDDGGSRLSGLGDVELNTQPPLEESGSVAEVAGAVVPSTVRIVAEFEGEQGGATGTGWVFDDQGHIITNNHVVADAAQSDGQIQIVDQDGNYYDASVVGRSPVYDLAVLESEEATELPAASIGRGDALRVGDPVVAVGYPLGLNTTVTSGIVSALGQPVSTGNARDDSSYIYAVQTDAAINPGNSGGPLIDAKGQVVGVNSAIATNGGGTVDSQAGNIGVGFAIPIEQVLTTADQILSTGEARYPLIGADVQTGGVQDQNGALLVDVKDGSPAQDAGLQTDDRITEVNGERITDGLQLIVVIRTYQPGETIEFTVERGNQDTQQVEVTLDGDVG
ncbi:trypsin-like peptidase domain-containing protein [Nocardioides panacisoli]|uniref:S1C family serine protease n=1 Tax=Nocardioides panacisoli TaxID=627624 RepID=UPI001C63545A|nr:trypsin-like peptidase domain-containing protein [Nocardioides panacisoli]QYJ02439.1 trypsin-like peptidase domain-containing protein [Nocardioides panacisoli]